MKHSLKYERFFNFLNEHFGITPTRTEMEDIIHEVKILEGNVKPVEVGNEVRVTYLGADAFDLDVSIPGTVTKIVDSNTLEVKFDCYNAPIKVKRNHIFISD